MPLGPGGYDSNGIWLYGEDDSEALASDLLNLGMQSVSDALGAGFGSILQIVSTTKTDTFSSNTASFNDVTGLSATITPSSTSSKILVIASIGFSDSSDSYASQFTLARDGVNLSTPTSPGSRTAVFFANKSMTTQEVLNGHVSFLDSPASTSSLVYNVRVRSENTANTIHINRGRNDSNGASFSRSVSTITLMEVAG